MYSLKEYFGVLDGLAPISLSEKEIARGAYDNSGIIVNHHDKIEKVLFSLDLSTATVKRAKALGCDTVITHHPAIYSPIKNIGESKDNGLSLAVFSGLNVVSMHLNLDIAENGIDYYLCMGLGGKKYKILDLTDENHGYGREFPIEKTLGEIVKNIKKEFKTVKVISYGKRKDFIKTGASFCGSGSSTIDKLIDGGKLNAGLIVTSDMPHHIISKLVENGKDIILIPHYTAENYGFKKFYESVNKITGLRVKSYYFEDKRFI